MADTTIDSVQNETKTTPKDDQELLLEIRNRFKYATDAWKNIREEAQIDMRYVIGDPWDPADKQIRKSAGRPALALDQLSQYCNQAINNLRQNKRGIAIHPIGNGANDKSAEFLQDLIRGIEYESNAQQTAYIPAFENAFQRSYGFWRIGRDYVGKDFLQKATIKGIPNPDSVVYDPDVMNADWSDANYVFVTEPVTKEEFKRRWPKAVIHDFGRDEMTVAPEWIKTDSVMVAEYWKAVETQRELLLIDDPNAGPTPIFRDELAEDQKGHKVLQKREFTERSIVQYITNGIEILEEIEQPGTIIPIVACLGKELYVTEADKTKRVILSAIRLARDPYMLYCYLVSQEAEEASMTPKAPFVGAKGQFESDAVAWGSVNKIPRAYLQYDPITDATGQATLPPPARPQFQPNFQAYEIAKESAIRAIQSAMGINPLPTPVLRQNQKSGVAIERVQEQENLGSFHFQDNFDRALQLTGRIILEWAPVVYDTEREVGIVKNDDSKKVVRINTPEPYQDGQEMVHHQLVDNEGNPVGEHGVTISTGPSYQSQREEVADLMDTLAQSNPPVFSQIADLAIRIRNLGPLGDEMAQRLVPPQFAQPGSPQSAVAQAQQLGQQVQQLHGALQLAVGEVTKLQQEKQGRIVENQYRMNIEKMKIDAQVAIAEINTKSQETMERLKWEKDIYSQLHSDAHETALQADQQQHEQQLAQQQAAVQQQQQEQAGSASLVGG